MFDIIRITLVNSLVLGSVISHASLARAQQSLSVAYPPENHQTTADRIFLIGTASPEGEVLVNGEQIRRSPQGHFAPSFPLAVGENTFQLRHNDEELAVTVTRISNEPEIPRKLGFAVDSLSPGVDITKLPGEEVCFSAVATPKAEVRAILPGIIVPLLPEPEIIDLPANGGVLVGDNAPILGVRDGKYRGCAELQQLGNLGKPQFEVSQNGARVTELGEGEITIANLEDLEVVEVIADSGVARTGASTNYSRLTPLPKGTRARVTGKEGEWLQLDYGAWIKAGETRVLPSNTPTNSLIRSITSRELDRETEIIFPLQVPVPVKIFQEGDRISLTLYNTIAQTDTIRLDNDPLIERLDWQQVRDTEIVYTFNLKTARQWGYDLRYKGTSLVLTLRHPPRLSRDRSLPLDGIKILLDPGHGGKEAGGKSPTGYPEKAINLVISKMLEEKLQQLGATVYLTRQEDVDLGLKERVAIIEEIEPDLAFSVHYNALPDNGDAENTQGISTFWYHPQAHSLAVTLHDYLVTSLNRQPAGVFWNNLALTRPHIAPTVLLELGFTINPWEFEWVSDRAEQKKLVEAIAKGIVKWLQEN